MLGQEDRALLMTTAWLFARHGQSARARALCEVLVEENPKDGVAAIARHMNYGLYRIEGRADCPRDALHICRMLSLEPEILERIEQKYRS